MHIGFVPWLLGTKVDIITQEKQNLSPMDGSSCSRADTLQPTTYEQEDTLMSTAELWPKSGCRECHSLGGEEYNNSLTPPINLYLKKKKQKQSLSRGCYIQLMNP